MENKKTTKKEFFNILLGIEEIANNEELTNFINHEIELIEKKSSSRKTTLTKTQKENLELIEIVYEELKSFDKPMQIKELIANSEKLANYSSSKVSALMTKLKNDNRVTRIEEKRVAYFKAN